MIRVLQELPSLDGGGIAKLLFDYYSNMDREHIHFDFIIGDFYSEGIYEKPLRDMGCKIYRLPQFKKERRVFLRQMKEIVKNGNYDVVHSHMGARGAFLAYYGKKYNVKKRIAHSHLANKPGTLYAKLNNAFFTSLAEHYSTHLFACGRDAGIIQWGEKNNKNGKIHIMRNAIDIEKFKFSDIMRDKKRKELGVQDKFVIGIVGRLSEQKNYPFLFRVYKEVIQTRDNTVLLIVGRGLEEEKIKKLAADMGIMEQTIFLGVRSDVPDLLNAFDLFVLPSLYEGLPVVLVEAQANGLRSIISDRITNEMNVTDLIEVLPINNTEKEWAEKIINAKSDTINRDKYAEQIAKAGYDIRVESLKMQDFYSN